VISTWIGKIELSLKELNITNKKRITQPFSQNNKTYNLEVNYNFKRNDCTTLKNREKKVEPDPAA
jgi:hypothetical protein